MKHYCKECEKITKFRHLDCELHGKECEEIVCTECGASLEVEVKMSKIQEKAIKEKCPACGMGDLHEVPNNEDTEMYLWCNNCDLSMDSSGGYTA